VDTTTEEPRDTDGRVGRERGAANEGHDRKDRVNVGLPPWIVAWLVAVLDRHPGVWRSKGDLALDVLKLGMRAFGAGVPVPRAAPPAAEGKGLNVSLPSEIVSWHESVLAERSDVARSRRDLVLVVLRIGMRAFEAAGEPTRLVVQSRAGEHEDAEIVAPEELVRKVAALLKAHPVLVKEFGYDSPAHFVSYAIWQRLDLDLQVLTDEMRDRPDPEREGIRAAVEGPKGSVVVTPEAVRAVQTFFADYRAFARKSYDGVADFVAQAIEGTFEADTDLAVDLEWDAEHPEEAAARDAWWRTMAEARARGDNARLVEMGQEQERAIAEGRQPWQKAGTAGRR